MATICLSGTIFPLLAPPGNSFAQSERASSALTGLHSALFERQFCDRLAIFSRVRSPIIHARSKISHHRLPSTHAARKGAFDIDLVPFARQLIPHILPEAILHHHIASAERVLAEPWGLQGCLYVHFEIDEVRHKLRVCLRLIPAAHNPERHANISLLRERRNDCVQWPLSSRERIW